MSRISCLMLAGLLVGANAPAADSPPAASTAATAPAPANAATPSAPGADLEAQLAAARQKLEAAARDVAQLSSQLGQSAMARVKSLRTRAVLGLQLQVEPSSKEQGATIMGVSPGGPAAEAGLAPGDVIIALNGESTTGPNAPRAVVDRMATVKPDTKVTVKVMRDGKPREFTVMARAGMADFFPPFNGPGWRPAQAWGRIETPPGPDTGVGGPGTGVGAIFEGMELADLSAALGQYFGTDQGVLVVRVPRDGDFLKLHDGDVILNIDGRVPENSSHATRILRSYRPGEKIHLKIMRQKKSMELEGTLPERRHAGRGPWSGPQVMPPPPPPQGRLVPLGAADSAAPLAAVPAR